MPVYAHHERPTQSRTGMGLALGETGRAPRGWRPEGEAESPTPLAAAPRKEMKKGSGVEGLGFEEDIYIYTMRVNWTWANFMGQFLDLYGPK
jgi:hypothetical protein